MPRARVSIARKPWLHDWAPEQHPVSLPREPLVAPATLLDLEYGASHPSGGSRCSTRHDDRVPRGAARQCGRAVARAATCATRPAWRPGVDSPTPVPEAREYAVAVPLCSAPIPPGLSR